MNLKRQKKLIALLILVGLIGSAIGLILYALKQNINLFYTPSELVVAKPAAKEFIRIGGYVKKGTVEYDHTGEFVHFTITDFTTDISVSFHGVLPNLFREGQGVVATGQYTGNKQLVAQEVLAKHDEKYLPRSIAEKIKRGKNP